MAKKLTFTFSPKAIVIFHLSLTLRHMVLTEGDAVTKLSTPTITFFMHDILGGSTPSERIVAGTIVNTQTSNFPFSKPNNRVFPFKGAIPLVDTNTGTNIPIHTSTMVVKNIVKNKVFIDNSNSLPLTLEKFLFGRITVIDDEITKGHELGAGVIGKAQGFHLVSSLDGSSRTMAFTALFRNDDNDDGDVVSFFGVHRTATQESCIVVVGGTGRYVNAKGYAKIETILSPEQHTTNGVETLLQISVYLS